MEVAMCTADGLWEAGGETKENKLPACIRQYTITVTANINYNNLDSQV